LAVLTADSDAGDPGSTQWPALQPRTLGHALAILGKPRQVEWLKGAFAARFESIELACYASVVPEHKPDAVAAISSRAAKLRARPSAMIGQLEEHRETFGFTYIAPSLVHTTCKCLRQRWSITSPRKTDRPRLSAATVRPAPSTRNARALAW